jgi:hypothetical protein
MSRQLIQNYYSKVDKVIQYGEVKNETAIRGAFHDLLNQSAEKRNKLGNRSALEWILDQYQRKETQRPNHRREVQHVSLRRL